MASIKGSTGNDSLTGTSGADVIVGLAGQDLLMGGGGDDKIEGGDGSDGLDGEAGNDWLIGGAGNDLYYIDSLGDRIEEVSRAGIDRVYSPLSYSLGYAVEQLRLTGTASVNATGNGWANELVGNGGTNRLDGGAGADLMVGGAGHDTYVVDNAGDLVTEGSGGGTDTVLSSVDFALGDYVERLTLTGTAVRGTGNALANLIIGNGAGNVLDGGVGADTLRGGGGNDVYLVDDARDIVAEGAGGGSDAVISQVSYALPANVEQLTLGGTRNISGTGNGGGNRITGNGGENLLNGGTGADVLTGGTGMDRFAFTTALSKSNVDQITDFKAGRDMIVLGGERGQPFVALASGALGSGAFRTGAAAADADDRIVYDKASGALLYDADGAGGAAALKIAILSPGLAISAKSFTVTGPANQLPTIGSGTAASVQENAAATTIVYQAIATDADGDRIAYSLSGVDAAALRIDQNGAVRLAGSADFETKSSYSFTVKAVDSSGTGSAKAVTLTVKDVAEAAGITIVKETSAANDGAGSAQSLARSLFTASNDPMLNTPGLPSLRIEGNVTTPGDRDHFKVSLKAGELLVLDVDATSTLDSFLRVFSPGGAEIASNDDLVSFDPGSTAHAGVSHNMDSLISFRAPTSGTYVFSVASFADETGATSDGAYRLNVSIGPPAPQAQLDAENAANLLSGSEWSALGLTYGFTSVASHYASGEASEEIAGGMQALNAQQQFAVRAILKQVSGLTNLSFSEAANPGGAQLRYALSGEPETAHAYYPGPGEGGDSWYNRSSYSGPAVGNYQWTTFVHETGHALGLKHGQEAPALSADRDSLEFSVMTYRSHIGAPVGEEDGGYTNETWGYPQTLMMYDIAALQRLYGADFTTNASNTVYSWTPTSGAFKLNGAVQWTPGGNRVFMTVWDGGGKDTYDLSAYAGGVKIDLRPGEWSTTSAVQLANLGNSFKARGNVANALQYNDDPRSLIENAVGGAGADTLIANKASNQLTGGAGRDLFKWMSSGDAGTGAAADYVTDFKVAEDDRIDLSAIDANPTTSGNAAFSFLGTKAFSGVPGQVRYEVYEGHSHVLADLNGDRVADLQIVVNNVASLAAGDFIF